MSLKRPVPDTERSDEDERPTQERRTEMGDLVGDAPVRTNQPMPQAVRTTRPVDPNIPPAPAMIPNLLNVYASMAGRPTAAQRRRRRKYGGFSRRSFKFLRWLYHLRKRRRFTQAQANNAASRAVVFRKAWAIAKGDGRMRITRADVMAAQRQTG